MNTNFSEKLITKVFVAPKRREDDGKNLDLTHKMLNYVIQNLEDWNGDLKYTTQVTQSAISYSYFMKTYPLVTYNKTDEELKNSSEAQEYERFLQVEVFDKTYPKYFKKKKKDNEVNHQNLKDKNLKL
jgi:hypothetical protein